MNLSKSEVIKTIGKEPITISQLRDKINENKAKEITKLTKGGKLSTIEALEAYKNSQIKRPELRNVLAELVLEKKIVEIVNVETNPKYSYQKR